MAPPGTAQVADLADGPIAAAEWASAATPGLIMGFLFSGQACPGSQGEIPARNGGAGTAEWIRAFTHSLMDLDFHYGGGHVRQVLLRYFRSEIVPLLRARHPEPVRRELFSAAAEVAEMPGAWLMSSLSHQANYLGQFQDALSWRGPPSRRRLGGRRRRCRRCSWRWRPGR
jgi:hypothetical protein